MLDRGKLAVLTMFAVALAAAMFAWWWNYSRGQKCLEFYGKDAALLVRTAQQVELLKLEPDDSVSNVDRLQFGGRTYAIQRTTDLSRAKGLIHARTSILDDTSFEWQTNLTDCETTMPYAVRFTGQSRVTLAFDFGCRRVWFVEHNKSATLIPKVAQGWESFLTRQAKESSGTLIHADQH